ncbi:MAG: purine-nucleoside phosphorylase [Candidatus Palauibacterales bacterium]|nr:purine-nucleoside phosphorylase [Candidatus Palauibacterales bacterium]
MTGETEEPGAPERAADGATVRRAAGAVRERVERAGRPVRPRLGVVLGSGLGGLEERFRDPVKVPAGEIPGWPEPRVSGHAGRVVVGDLAGVPAVGLAGRAHLYEGHPPDVVALPARVLCRLGIDVLFLSNAAGAVNRDFRPGELMAVADHLNFMFRSPLAGPAADDESRWPDLSDAWDPVLRGVVRETAAEEGVPLREGVYAAVLGPSYETPAEVRMLERLGADAVGMSTVPEVLAARSLGVRCVGVSCLTNYAAGVAHGELSHDEVLETTERVAEDFQRLVLRTVERLEERGELGGR